MKRRLADAGFPHNGNGFTLGNIHGQVAQHVDGGAIGPIALADTFKGEHRGWMVVGSAAVCHHSGLAVFSGRITHI
ncbi:MAG: hypothetical protein R2861_08490 [Desulfobacterales bacterium]